MDQDELTEGKVILLLAILSSSAMIDIAKNPISESQSYLKIDDCKYKVCPT